MIVSVERVLLSLEKLVPNKIQRSFFFFGIYFVNAEGFLREVYCVLYSDFSTSDNDFRE